SRAHVAALGAVLSDAEAAALREALDRVAEEIADGSFSALAAVGGSFEDVHGAIDARVRELAGKAGERLHAGRSRNDQVATTLLLYARERARRGADLALDIAAACEDRAAAALEKRTLLAATTHWQPAQPVLLAFWLQAASEPFVRTARHFRRVAADAERSSPLGSGAVAGSSLPLDRTAAARELGFASPSRNALDSVGGRDVALDLLHAVTRAVVAASRPSEELVIWSAPAFGYVRLADAASTGSSLMPQKKNPDPFELVRASAAGAIGALSGALASLKGIGLSYHRDLQETKALVLDGTERGLATLEAFEIALGYVTFDHAKMTAAAAAGFTLATDVADALIARGVSAREAHRLVGETIGSGDAAGSFDAECLAALRARSGIADLKAPLDALASVESKRTAGSTHPLEVAQAIEQSQSELRQFSSSDSSEEA
ncbi:MAG: argininosuccinate lyase, partial [Candidatus Eremiobacteraeota bacterium]|nr:argininosuccinate lyase [Candidatus Eremiobacteraeota bacterium]